MNAMRKVGGGRPRAQALAGLQRLLPVMCAAAAVSFNPDCSAAKDLGALAEFVAPAYTAMNFATICARDVPWLLSQPRGLRGSAIEYAQHVKDEAISSLTHDEAVRVLRAAADAARARARQELRGLASMEPALQEAQVRAWCRGFVTEFIVLFIGQHDGSHQELLQRMEQAKR